MAGAVVVQGLATAGQAAYKAIQNVSPETKAKIMSYVSTATGGRVGTPDKVAAYATGTKEGFATVVTGAVRAGVDPALIFTDQVLGQLRDAQLQQFAREMKDEFNRVYAVLDSTSKLTGSSNANRALALSAVAWASKKFGGSNLELTEAHAMLRLFTSISEAELGSILTDRRLFQAIRG